MSTKLVIHFQKGCVTLYERVGKNKIKMHESSDLIKMQNFIDSKYRM